VAVSTQLVRKCERRVVGFDERILALYARGMSVRDIQGHLQEMYGVAVSPDLISRVTDAVAEDVLAWQQRPLDAVYCIDALVVNPRRCRVESRPLALEPSLGRV
jgi:transposase-like protein